MPGYLYKNLISPRILYLILNFRLLIIVAAIAILIAIVAVSLLTPEPIVVEEEEVIIEEEVIVVEEEVIVELSNLHVGLITYSPTVCEFPKLQVTFTDDNGKNVNHVNYNISVSQNDDIIILEREIHHHSNVNSTHTGDVLLGVFPMEIDVTPLGFGQNVICHPVSHFRRAHLSCAWGGDVGGTVALLQRLVHGVFDRYRLFNET